MSAHVSSSKAQLYSIPAIAFAFCFSLFFVLRSSTPRDIGNADNPLLTEKRRKEYEDEQSGKALVRHERNGSYDKDEEEGRRRRPHRKDRDDEYDDDRREYRRHRATDEQDALYDTRQPSRSHRRD